MPPKQYKKKIYTSFRLNSIRLNMQTKYENFVCIFFRRSDEKVEVSMDLDSNLYINNGFLLIGKKLGVKREVNLLKIVLKEFSRNYFESISKKNTYLCDLKSHVNALGYKNNDHIRKINKSIKNLKGI